MVGNQEIKIFQMLDDLMEGETYEEIKRLAEDRLRCRAALQRAQYTEMNITA